jgi:AcrR family transcriptional regulator
MDHPTPHLRMTGADRREQLLDVALDLFSRQGFDGTSVRDIAAAANVTDGLIYRYFDSKEKLLAEVIGRARRRLAESPPGAGADGDPVALVERLLIDLAEFLRANQRLIDLIWYEIYRGADHDQFEMLRGETLESVRAALGRGVAEGTLVLADTDRAARTLMGVAFSFTCANRCLTPAEWRAELATQSRYVATIFVDGARRRA